MSVFHEVFLNVVHGLGILFVGRSHRGAQLLDLSQRLPLSVTVAQEPPPKFVDTALVLDPSSEMP
jgi:hypothetical protein